MAEWNIFVFKLERSSSFDLHPSHGNCVNCKTTLLSKRRFLGWVARLGWKRFTSILILYQYCPHFSLFRTGFFVLSAAALSIKLIMRWLFACSDHHQGLPSGDREMGGGGSPRKDRSLSSPTCFALLRILSVCPFSLIKKQVRADKKSVNNQIFVLFFSLFAVVILHGKLASH